MYRERKSTEEMKQRVITKFGNIFDMSLFEWNGNHVGKGKVKLICPEKHVFETNFYVFMKTGKCNVCTKEARKKELINNKNPYLEKDRIEREKRFIDKARKIYNDYYDYSKTYYRNSILPLIIICPEHGEFKQTSKRHFDCKPLCCHNKSITKKPYSFNNNKPTKDDLSTIETYHRWWEKNKEYCVNTKIPKDPHILYKMSWHKISAILKGENYMSLYNAKCIVQNLYIKGKGDYYMWWEENKLENLKIGLPKRVDLVYK